jgi:TetR/AcrR family transcriptional regulator, transcriptional repressor for nem operon
MQQEKKKSARTRQFIIESTSEIFNKKGVGGTSLNDITNATGLTKGSIYGNFQNKEEVAAAAFDYNWTMATKHVASELATYSTAKEKLMAYTSAYRTMMKRVMQTGGCPLLNSAVDVDDTNTLLRDQVYKAFKKWKGSLALLIKKAIADGEFKAEINPQQAAISIIAMIEGGLMMANLTRQSSYLTNVLLTVEEYIATMLVQ